MACAALGVTASPATTDRAPLATSTQHVAATSTAAAPEAKSSFCNFTFAQPLLVEGSIGVAIEQAQCKLNWGFAFGSSTNFGNGPHGGLKVDGDFGSGTLAATKAFQRAVHLSADDEIGNDTWSELNRCVTMTTFCRPASVLARAPSTSEGRELARNACQGKAFLANVRLITVAARHSTESTVPLRGRDDPASPGHPRERRPDTHLRRPRSRTNRATAMNKFGPPRRPPHGPASRRAHCVVVSP